MNKNLQGSKGLVKANLLHPTYVLVICLELGQKDCKIRKQANSEVNLRDAVDSAMVSARCKGFTVTSVF